MATLSRETSKNDRNNHQQCKAGKCGLDKDDGGHLIPTVLGGPGEAINLVPMDANLNRGEWRTMEKEWQDAVKNDKKVEVAIKPVYTDDTKRPSSFKVD